MLVCFININDGFSLCNICKKQSSTYWLLQGENFCSCNISILNVSEFAIQGADQFVAPFW